MEKYICSLSDLKEREPHFVNVDGLEIGIFLINDKIKAFENRCPHANGPICLGDVRGAIKVELNEDKSVKREYVSEDDIRIVCPWHGLEFNIDSKECVTEPMLKIRDFETSIKGEDVYIKIPSVVGSN